MAMSISVLCFKITKPEPTMSHGRVFHVLNVQKDVNFKTKTLQSIQVKLCAQ